MRCANWAAIDARFPDIEGGNLAPHYPVDAATPEPYIRHMPAAGHLVELEQQFAGLLMEFEVLSAAWPNAPRAVDRASIGREQSCRAGTKEAARRSGPPGIGTRLPSRSRRWSRYRWMHRSWR